jgi:hypothetical protein
MKEVNAMATDSFWKIVHMYNDFADRYIAAEAEMKANPPKPIKHEINWGDPKEFAAALRKKYNDEK